MIVPYLLFASCSITAKTRIVTLYQILHDAIHAKSGQTGNLKLQYIRTEKEIVMGWVSISLLYTSESDIIGFR